MKECSKCNVGKPLSEFYKFKLAKDGLQSYCKECFKKYYKKYYPNNKDEVRERNKKRYKKNIIKVKKHNKRILSK
jgi:hypothetical protein